MNLTPEFLMQMMAFLGTGAAIYGGIRADLRGMHARLNVAEGDIKAGRERMDSHIERTLIDRLPQSGARP